MALISASILGCKHTEIGDSVRRADRAGASLIHIDVMDGVYVDNLTFGPQLVNELRDVTQLPLSIHLETERPDRIFRLFEHSEADIISFQLDACSNPIHLMKEIKAAGKAVGIGIGPAYAVDSIKYLLPYIDYLILMSVEPGYGGQRFESSVYEKLIEACQLRESSKATFKLCIDGGVNTENAHQLVESGADILICGSSAFRNNQIEKNIQELIKSAQ